MDSPGKNTGVGCHAVLHGIFCTQGSNLCLLHYRRIIYPLSHLGSPEHQIEAQIFLKNESNIRDLWDDIKHANLWITGILEREEREKGIENVFEEIRAKNFPKLKKKTDIQI